MVAGIGLTNIFLGRVTPKNSDIYIMINCYGQLYNSSLWIYNFSTRKSTFLQKLLDKWHILTSKLVESFRPRPLLLLLQAVLPVGRSRLRRDASKLSGMNSYIWMDGWMDGNVLYIYSYNISIKSSYLMVNNHNNTVYIYIYIYTVYCSGKSDRNNGSGMW